MGHDLPIRLWDGTEVGSPDRGYRIILSYPWSLRGMLSPLADLQLGRAYLADFFDVEGSMVAALTDAASVRLDLESFIVKARLGAKLITLPKPPPEMLETHDVARVDPTRRLHSRQRDAGAIRHHYDIGNDFYRLFLDENLVYSCAYFTEDDDDLDRAQIRKLDLVCHKLGLRPGMSLLDIGCGWGALVIHAARHYRVSAVGVTLSKDQAEVGRRRVAEAGLGDKVEIRLDDYRDVTGDFDAVASVGMFEHVGSDQLSSYFRTAHELTAPGGRFLNHGITTGRRRIIRDLAKGNPGFVGTYVFPDGALVPASRAVTEMEDAGFELLDVEQLRPHYALTLKEWTRRIEDRADDARRLADEGLYRTWRAYMAGSVVGFQSGDLGVIQVLGGKNAVTPLGRSWMLPTQP